MTDQFTLPNTQYMISTMATMGFYSKPLLDICSKKIIGNLFNCYTKKSFMYICTESQFLDFTIFFTILTLDLFLENLHGIPFNRMLPVLLSCRELHYRDLDLLNGISDYVASLIDVWTNKQV